MPRRSAFARIVRRDEKGNAVLADRPPGDDASLPLPAAEPEYPIDHEQGSEWTEVSGIYRAPTGAQQAIVELYSVSATNGTVEWSDVQLQPHEAPPSRKVRLAAVHFQPHGGTTAMDNCRRETGGGWRVAGDGWRVAGGGRPVAGDGW